MAAPFATATVQARLEWGNLDAEFETRVRAAAVRATQAAERHFKDIEFAAKVKLNADTELFSRETQDRLDALRLHADVTLKADATKFGRETRARLRQLSLPATVTLRADNTQLRAQLQALSGNVTVGLRVTQTKFRAFVTDLNARLRAADIVAPVRLDVANAAQFRALIAQLTQTRTQIIRIRTVGGGTGGGGGAGGDVAGLDLSLGRVAKTGLKIAGIAALIGAIGGAAGLAAGAVGALAVGLAGVGIAGVAGLGTTILGLQGIGNAFSALNDAADSSGEDMEAQAKAVASATRQVESAERGVRDAKKDARRAEEDLTRARKDAKDQIDELNFSLKGAALDEKDAAIALKEAQAELRKTKADPNADRTDRDRARLNVEKALLRQEEVGRRNTKLAEETAEANAKGIEGSDQVVAAKERISDANERVSDSEQALVDANTALQEALSETSSAADKAAEAMEKLSPNARAFVLAMMNLKPQFEDLRDLVQDNMFAGLDSVFTNLVTTSMPMLEEGLGGVATSINGAAHSFAEFWSSAEAQDSLSNLFAGTATMIDAMQPGLAALSGGILDIANGMAPVADQVGASVGGLLGQVGSAFSEAFESGALTHLFTVFSTMIDGLGGGLNALLGGLIEFGNTLGPVLGPVLQVLGESIAALAPSLGQLGVAFGDALIVVLPVLSEFISALADGLTPIMPVLANLLKALGAALTPLIPPLSQILQTVGTALVGAINALAPAIGPLGDAFAALINALAPILPLVAEVIGMLVSALAPALTTIFDAFAPVIRQLVDQLRPVFEQIAPILADVAMQLGQALANALVQLSPVLPIIIDGFIRIVNALAPFLPQLVQIWSEYLPKFLDLLVFLAETVLPPVITGLEWLITNVMPLVIDIFRVFAETAGDKFVQVKDTIAGAIEGIKGFFQGLSDKVGATKDWIVEKWNGLVDFVTTLPERMSTAASGMWDGLKDAFKGALNWIIQAWNNFRIEMKIPDNIPLIGGKGITIDTPDLPLLARGGLAGKASNGVLFGPGTGVSDDILALDASGLPTARVAHGEMVINKAQTDRNLPLLSAINAGWTPSPEFVRALVYGLPAHASGGVIGGASIPAGTVTAPSTAGSSAGKQLNREQWIALFGNAAEFDRILAEQNARNQQQLVDTEKRYIGFGETVTGVLDGLGGDVFPRHMEGLNQVAQTTFGTTDEGQKNWTTLGATVGDVTKGMLDNTFPALQQGLTGVADFARGVVDGVGGDFNRLPSLVAPPINWIIDKVVNTGLRDAWMGVKGAVPDLPDWPAAVPLLAGFASGGIMSGYSPGRDDRIIAVGGGEAIMRPEWTRAVGPDYVNSMNAAARSGGVSAVQRLAGFYADGGIVDAMTSVVQEKFPMLSMTSGLRFTDGGYHSKGMAADFSNVGAGQSASPEMNSLANWIADNFPPPMTLQLIHKPFTRNIGQGVGWVGDGDAFYEPWQMDAHRDHVHWATDRLVSSDGTNAPAPGVAASSAGTGRRIAELFDKPLTELRSQMPDFGPSLFGQLPGAMLGALQKAASAQLGKTAGKFGSLDAGTTDWDISAGAEQWHDNIVAALIREGFEPSERNILLTKKQIMTESSGNPNAIQQVQDVNSGGNEAVGLLQVIPGTFADHRNPDLPNDRTDPDASLSAGLRWYRYAYGDDLGVMWGQGHGYDQGGIARGIGFMPKKILDPERVLSPEMTPLFERLVEVLERPEIASILRSLDPGQALTPIAAPELVAAAVAPADVSPLTGAASAAGQAQDAYDYVEGYDSKNLRSQLAEFGRVFGRWQAGEADLEAGQAWMDDQEFAPRVEQWAVNAVKEIGGQFTEPVGLSGLWGQEVDGYVRDQRLAAIDANDALTAQGKPAMFAETVNFYGMDPGKVGDEVIRAMMHGMAPVTQTYRRG